MKLRVLFKQHRNKSFNYKPRYYDERKERLDNMKQKYEIKSDAEYRIKRRTSFRDDWKSERKELDDNNSRRRLLVIFIFLAMGAYALLRYSNLDKLF